MLNNIHRTLKHKFFFEFHVFLIFKRNFFRLRAGFLFLRTTVIILTVLIGGLFVGPTVVKPLVMIF